jgi:hypothetical protein
VTIGYYTRFQLLSLLIDPPINDEEEKRLLSKLTFLERIGVQLLERIPPSREEIKAKLGVACAGGLHCLNEKQRKAVNRLHWSCVLQVGKHLIIQLLAQLPTQLSISNQNREDLMQRKSRLPTCPRPAASGRSARSGPARPGLFENFLVWEYETDGVLDADWTCSARQGATDRGFRGLT